MEVFVFVRMGGRDEAMLVKPLDDSCDTTVTTLQTFSAKQSQCFLEPGAPALELGVSVCPRRGPAYLM